MHVGHKRHVASALAQFGADFTDICSFAYALSGKAHNVAPGFCDTHALLHRPFDIVGRSVGHRLEGNGCVSSDDYVAYGYTAAGTPSVTVFRHLSVGLELIFYFGKLGIGFHDLAGK